MASVPEIERVEWRSVSAGELQVEVTGRWPVAARGQPPVLRVGPGHEARAFAAREVRWGTEEPGSAEQAQGVGEAATFRAAFAVPVGLRRDLGHGLAMRIGAREVALPGARAAAAGTASFTGLAPNVVDPAVLAERRARRAELSEETLARRAAQAEAQVEDLEAQLDQLEHQLEHALGERDRIARDLSARERELRVSRQREYSEQQLRVEAEEQRRRAERQAEVEVGGLRRRLVAAERRVADVEGELERARRRSAESEHAAEAPLRAELRRRQQVQEHVRAELEGLRAELEHLRGLSEQEAAQRARADERTGALEQELAVLRAELEDRERELDEAERTEAAIRSQIDEMSSTLRSERQQHLDVERNLREQLEAQAGAVHATIAELRSELERAANDLRLREQREAELQRIIEEFVTLATALRENFEREMADARRDLEVRVAAERDSYSRELGHLEARVAELRSQLEHAAELSEQLELRTSTETQATQALAAARAELERLRQSEARARGEVARLRAEHDRSRPGSISEGARRSASAGADSTPPPVSEEGAGRSAPPAQDRPPAPGEGRRAGPGQPRSTESAEAGALASDLADAFRRLREQVSQVAAQAQHPVLPQERPVGPKDDLAPPDRADAPPGDEAPAGRDEAERLEPSTGSELAPPDRPGPTAAEPLTPWRRHLLWTLGRTRAGESWITSAIVRLAQGGDRRAAGRLLVGLLPVQGVLIDHELTYDLEIRELGRFRVLVGRGTAEVRPLAPGAHPDSRPPEFGLSGDAAELAPLAGGSSPRRLRGVSITGRRRGVRRLLRGLGQPVTFEDLLRAGIRPDPLVLLRAVVAVIDPAWTAGREFSVAYVIEAEHGASRIGPYRVAVTPGEAVRVLETSVAVGSPPLAATVLVAERALMPLLAGLPLPAGERAEIEGDAAAVLLLGSWIERAQTEPAPGR